jgi:hypothetical protein
MASTTEPVIMQAVDASIVETVEAFVRFRRGFHGDTGIRDYLYHRLMSNLDGGTYTSEDGHGTLLAQAEWYTALKYRNTTRGERQGASRGRFDVGIPDPKELDLPVPRPLVAFECGRNKSAVRLLCDIEAAADYEWPEPADITKLAREIRYAGLPSAYALQFFDKEQWRAKDLLDQLQSRISAVESERLHILVLQYIGGSGPILTFLPTQWEERIRLQFSAELERIEHLTCVSSGAGVPRSMGTVSGRGNRVPPEVFLSSCSPEARALIEAITRRYGRQITPLFGGKSMSINRRPKGRLLKIEKAGNFICHVDPTVSRELASLLQLSVRPTYDIESTPDFRETVIAALGRTLQDGPHGDVAINFTTRPEEPLVKT